ncbi:MAG: hypothetical protein RLN92_08220 [Alloalcanivorax xenomutans]|jgi:hypothetical protein
MKLLIKVLTDFVFYIVLALSVLYVLSDIFGMAHFGRGLGRVVVRAYVIGAPVSFLLSAFCFFVFGDGRYKWYLLVSGLEVGILCFVFWIIYKAQI